ncbi:hypothetical protein ACXR0O_23475 [Verrucomicrobiota bacterium sgz303538]
MGSPLLICFLGTVAIFAQAQSESVPANAQAAKVAAPAITQEDILEALGLEIKKFRLVGIPKGQRIKLQLSEWLSKPTGSRSLARLTVMPDNGWVELLISARSEADGCRRLDVKVNHGNPVLNVFAVEIEKLFGKGKRALPGGDSVLLLKCDSNEYPYDGSTYSLATFRLNSGKLGRHYSLELVTYPLSEDAE